MCSLSKTDCVCYNNYIPTVNKYLSSCVKSRCTLRDYKINLLSASSLYNGYCTLIRYFAITVNSNTTVVATSLSTTATVTMYVSKNLAPKGIRYLDFRFLLASLVSYISFSTGLI